MGPKGLSREPGAVERSPVIQNELLKERLRGILIGLSMDKDGIIGRSSLVDNLDIIISAGLEDSMLLEYEGSLERIESNLEWKAEESRPISELVLKKGSK